MLGDKPQSLQRILEEVEQIEARCKNIDLDIANFEREICFARIVSVEKMQRICFGMVQRDMIAEGSQGWR